MSSSLLILSEYLLGILGAGILPGLVIGMNMFVLPILINRSRAYSEGNAILYSTSLAMGIFVRQRITIEFKHYFLWVINESEMRRFEPTNEGAGQRLSMSSYGILQY
jgi:hypothetical protein